MRILNYKKSNLVKKVGLSIGLIIFFIGILIEIKLIGYIGTILMVGSILQTIIYYRCPNCNESFNIRGKNPKYCPECGYKLED